MSVAKVLATLSSLGFDMLVNEGIEYRLSHDARCDRNDGAWWNEAESIGDSKPGIDGEAVFQSDGGGL